MNNILKTGLRFSLKNFVNPGRVLSNVGVSKVSLTPTYSRTLWHMCSTTRINGDFLKPVTPSECCRCGCSGLLHTGGEKDLVQFLEQEIVEEKKAQKMQSLPAELDGFQITSDEAELTFTKKNQFETIIVSMNVNHSVDTDEIDENSEGEMKSRPAFEVDIVRDKKTLNFSCSFTQFDAGETDAADIYEIAEITYFEGDWQDKTYSVAADLLDENLYDLFMVVLNEKGITKKFISKVSDIATHHEHSQYIGLLENLRKFSSTN